MSMKKKNYFIFLCMILMMLSVFMGLNSLTWLMMWVSMEMTLMFFIPRLIHKKSLIESFSTLKYFVFQSLGSIFFILGSLDFFFYFNTFGLFMKLGLFPNHFWMFMVSKSLNWFNFFLLMTVQKILPLMFFIYSMKYILWIYIILILFNSIFSNLSSLNQMDLRFLMIFSSMNHMTWMVISSMMNFFFLYFYFFFYLMLSYYLNMNFNEYNVFYIFQLFSKSNFNLNMNAFFIFFIFFSFMGFPPLVGFLMKLISMFSLTFFFFFMYMLLMQNLMISYSYMRVVIFLLLNLSRSSTMNKFNKSYLYNFFFFMFMIII